MDLELTQAVRQRNADCANMANDTMVEYLAGFDSCELGFSPSPPSGDLPSLLSLRYNHAVTQASTKVCLSAAPGLLNHFQLETVAYLIIVFYEQVRLCSRLSVSCIGVHRNCASASLAVSTERSCS